jgi:hypothetical protein
MKLYVFLRESAAADRDGIVAGPACRSLGAGRSHSHKGDTS